MIEGITTVFAAHAPSGRGVSIAGEPLLAKVDFRPSTVYFIVISQVVSRHS